MQIYHAIQKGMCKAHACHATLHMHISFSMDTPDMLVWLQLFQKTKKDDPKGLPIGVCA